MVAALSHRISLVPEDGRQLGRIRVHLVDGTTRESEVFRLLCRARGSPVSRQDLATHVWGHTQVNPSDPYRQFLSKLQRKLAALGYDGLILNDHENGWRLLLDEYSSGRPKEHVQNPNL